VKLLNCTSRSLRLRDSLDTLTIGLPRWGPSLWNTLRGMLLTAIREPSGGQVQSKR